jgi:hypothetical protein
MSAGAAPGPFERTRDEAGCDGIERQIAAGGDEMHVARDLARHRMGAEEVGAATVSVVVPTRVPSVEPLKRDRETRIPNPDDCVVVGSHQHVREQCQLEAFADRGEAVEEILAVGIDDEEEALVTPPSGEVVNAFVERT